MTVRRASAEQATLDSLISVATIVAMWHRANEGCWSPCVAWLMQDLLCRGWDVGALGD